MAVTILLLSSNNFFSKIIRFILGSPISHSAIGFTYNGVESCLHAAWLGVQINPRSEVLSNHAIVAEFEVLTDMDDEVVLAEKKIGEPYDTLGLFGYLPVLLARKFGIGIHNPLASKSAVVCSEFIVEMDINHEIPEFAELDPADVTPVDLYDICLTGKSFKKLP